MRVCSKCGIPKDEDDFGWLNKGFNKKRTQCKVCHNKDVAKWTSKNPDYHSKWRKNNPEYIREYFKNNPDYWIEWRKDNPEKAKLYNKTQYEKIKGKLSAQYKERFTSDQNFRMKRLLRSRLWQMLKLKRSVKAATTLVLLGCSITDFWQHIVSLFDTGMTVGKVMNGEIHIDHIIPCDAFDLSKIEEQKKCFHYTNLQPLWAIDNRRKSSKIQ